MATRVRGGSRVAPMVGHYRLGQTLGQGNFGRVKFATDVLTGKSVAIKIMNKQTIREKKMGDQIRQEISVMKLINHPHVIELKDVLVSKTTIFLVMELVTGGALFDHIASDGKCEEDQALRYFRQLIYGIEYCHANGICHRDLKPENLLLDENKDLKISDFGLSAICETPEDGGKKALHYTTCGTPSYVAPEVLMNKRGRGYDGQKADIWSAGVILYVLLAGFLPFDEVSTVELFRKIVKADVAFPSWISPSAISLLQQIMNPDPSKRVTIEEIKKHPWFVGQDGEGDSRDGQGNLVLVVDREKIVDCINNIEDEFDSDFFDSDFGSEDEDADEDEDDISDIGRQKQNNAVCNVVDTVETKDGSGGSHGNDKTNDNTHGTEGQNTLQDSTGDSNTNNDSKTSNSDQIGGTHRSSKEIKDDESDTEDGTITQPAVNNNHNSNMKRSETKERKRREHSKPKMNAFDLINMVGGAAMNRMFQKGTNKRNDFTQFPSTLSCDAITRLIKSILNEFTCVIRFKHNKSKFRIKGEWKADPSPSPSSSPSSSSGKLVNHRAKVPVYFIIQLYEMSPSLHMVEVRRLKGYLSQYTLFYDKFKAQFSKREKEIISAR